MSAALVVLLLLRTMTLLVLLLLGAVVLLLLILLLLVLLLLGVGAGRRLLRSSLAAPAHLLVVGLVLGQNLLSEFLLTLVDIRIKLVTVFPDRKLLVIIDGDVDLFGAVWLLVRVVKLGNVGVLQGLFG